MAEIHNHIRGLSPYPAAIAGFTDVTDKQVPVKIYSSHLEYFVNSANTGSVATDGKTFIAIEHPEGRIFIDELQIPGKKKLQTADYLRGSQLSTGGWRLKPL
jgi:methionyl-tRNA formyltransferase